jgi:hypothetical protein
MKDVCMDLIPLTDKVSKYFRVFDCTEEDGSYALKDMPPGKYLIVVNKDNKISSTEPFPTLYYPNAFEKEKATIIDMGEGDVRENYDIHVPAQSETITAEGVFLYSDGKPVIEEFVEFIADAKRPEIDGNSRSRTDSQGHFSIKILKGLQGKLYGKMFTYIGQFENCPELDKIISSTGKTMSEVTTEGQQTTTDVDLNGIELRYGFPGCKKAKDDEDD